MTILVKTETQRSQRLMKDRDAAIGLLQKVSVHDVAHYIVTSRLIRKRNQN